MYAEVEKIYMDLLVEIGRSGLNRKIFLAWGNKKKRLVLIREGDYREDLIESPAYDLIGSYRGSDGYPRFSDIYEDINAFIQEETQKEYGCRPELQRFAEAG